MSKTYKSKGLYFIVCLCTITLNNLLECWLYENVNLVLLWISRMLGTRWQSMTVFFEKTIESKKCRKVNFLQVRHFFQGKLGKTVDLLNCYCNLLVAIGELQLDLRQYQKWPVRQKNLISSPDWPEDQPFKLRKSKFWVRRTFSQ